jgi:hypothetical protein
LTDFGKFCQAQSSTAFFDVTSILADFAKFNLLFVLHSIEFNAARCPHLKFEAHIIHSIQHSSTTTLYHNASMASAGDDLNSSATLDEEISRLCSLSEEDLQRAKGSSKLSGITLDRAKQLSSHLSLNKSFNKPTLIDNIIKKRKRITELSTIHHEEADAEESDQEGQKFVGNVNTFPRLCNIILQYPNAVIRSALLASKYALQNKETNQNQPIFVDTCAKFNSATFNSGGLVSDHAELLSAKIDPEKHNPGKISPKQLFKLFNSNIRIYAEIMQRYTASGKHNWHDFFLYCHGNRNPLYLHLILAKIGDPELNSYCNEGADLEGNFSFTSILSFFFIPLYYSYHFS